MTILQTKRLVATRHIAAQPEPRRSSSAAFLLAVGFCLLLGVPAAVMILTRPALESPGEQRKLAAMPSLRGLIPVPRGSFRRDFKAFVEDHFGFRTELIGLRADLLFHGLGVSPSTKVVCGRDGWLFVGGERSDNEVVSSREERPFSDRDLTTIRKAICKRSDWARARGARFLLVVAPNKATIYPEYLPSTEPRAPRKPGLDQVFDDLRSNTDVEFLDLRPALLEAKARIPIYYRLDTHWNAVGGLVASKSIADRLRAWFPRIRPILASDYEVVSQPGRDGDLSRMLGTVPTLKEDGIKLVARRPVLATAGEERFSPSPDHPQGSDGVITRVNQDPGSPTALVLRDSFLTEIVPLLSEGLGRTDYLWTYKIPRSADDLRVDVVIFEVVERSLLKMAELDADPNFDPVR